MLENVKNLLSDGVTALGGILIVFGLVNLGLTMLSTAGCVFAKYNFFWLEKKFEI